MYSISKKRIDPFNFTVLPHLAVITLDVILNTLKIIFQLFYRLKEACFPLSEANV